MHSKTCHYGPLCCLCFHMKTMLLKRFSKYPPNKSLYNVVKNTTQIITASYDKIRTTYDIFTFILNQKKSCPDSSTACFVFVNLKFCKTHAISYNIHLSYLCKIS